MLKPRTLLIVGTFVLLVVAGTLFFVFRGGSERLGGGEIRIGGHTTMLGAPLQIATTKGYFGQEGLRASIVPVESSKVSMTAMLAGDFDIVIGSLSAGSFNVMRTGDLVIIADASRVVPSVIVRNDLIAGGEVTKLSDLRSRSVMTPREGSSSYFALTKLLKSVGLTIQDIRPKYLSDTETLAALSAKQLDAAILNEPHATAAIEQGIGQRFLPDKVSEAFPEGGQQHMVLFARRNTVRDHPPELRRFLKGYARAVQDYLAARDGKEPRRAEVIKIIAGYTRDNASTVDKAVWPMVAADLRPDVGYMQQMFDQFVAEKLIDAPYRLKDHVDLELLP